MKRIGNSSKSFYPGILKEYIIDSIFKSRYGSKVIYDDLDNLSMYIKGFCINSFNINMVFKEIFRHYENISFDVTEIKRIFHNKYAKEYLIKVNTVYKGAKWIIPIKLIGVADNFPVGIKDSVYLSRFKLEKDMEKVPDSQTVPTIDNNWEHVQVIMKGIMFNNNLLLELYKINGNLKDKKKVSKAIENLYNSNKDSLVIRNIKDRIEQIRRNINYRSNWKYFTYRENIKIKYDDVMCVLDMIYVLLKGGVVNE